MSVRYYTTTQGNQDDLLQELKAYLASFPTHNLYWKTAKAFALVRVLRDKAKEVFDYALFTAGDYEDFTKPVILSHTTFLEDRAYKSIENFYRGLKELLGLGLVEYVSGKYAKQDAYKEKKKVFGEKAYKTRSYYETNAYYIIPAIAYGVVASFLMERKDVPPALLTQGALRYREKMLKAFGKDFASLSMKELNEKIKELRPAYLLPAFTLYYFDLELLDPFSEEVRDLSERLKVLFTGEPQQLTLPMSTSGTGDKVNLTHSDTPPNHSDTVKMKVSDTVRIKVSDTFKMTVNHQTFNPHPPNLHTHTNEKEGLLSETQSQKVRPVKTSASSSAKPKDLQKDLQEDRSFLTSSSSPSKDQPKDQPKDGSSFTAFDVYSRLPKHLKDWIKDKLKEKGVREPLALLKRISPEELEENLKDFLKAEMDAELYEFLKDKLEIYDLTQFHLLPKEEREVFLAQKDEKILQDYRAWERARALKEPVNTVFLHIYKTLTWETLPKEVFKRKVQAFIKEIVEQKEKQKELASVVSELLRRLKTLGYLTEYEVNRTTMVRLSVKKYSSISGIINEWFSGAPKPEPFTSPPTEEKREEERSEEDGYEDDVDINEIPF